MIGPVGPAGVGIFLSLLRTLFSTVRCGNKSSSGSQALKKTTMTRWIYNIRVGNSRRTSPGNQGQQRMGWLVVHRLRACVCVCACVRMCARAPDGGDGINCRREEFRGRWRWRTAECVSVSWLVVMVVVAVVMVMLLVLSSSLLHLSDAGAGHGAAGRLELDLGISPSLVHGGAVRGLLADLGHFHRRLVLHAIVPGTLGRGSGLVVLVGRRAGRLLRSARGHLLRRRHLLGHLLRVGDDGRLLLDGRRGVGGVQGVRGRLCGLVRVEAVLGGRAAARRREGAGAPSRAAPA